MIAPGSVVCIRDGIPDLDAGAGGDDPGVLPLFSAPDGNTPFDDAVGAGDPLLVVSSQPDGWMLVAGPRGAWGWVWAPDDWWSEL